MAKFPASNESGAITRLADLPAGYEAPIAVGRGCVASQIVNLPGAVAPDTCTFTNTAAAPITGMCPAPAACTIRVEPPAIVRWSTRVALGMNELNPVTMSVLEWR